MRNSYKILVGKHLGKRPFGGPRRRREDESNMGFWEVGCKYGRRLELAQNHFQRPAIWW